MIYWNFFLFGPTTASLLFYSQTTSKLKIYNFNQSQTQIVRVEGRRTDHWTELLPTSTTLDWILTFVKLRFLKSEFIRLIKVFDVWRHQFLEQGQLRRERRKLWPRLRRRIHFGKGRPGRGGGGCGDDEEEEGDATGGRVVNGRCSVDVAERPSQSSRSAQRAVGVDDLRPLPVREADREGSGFDSRDNFVKNEKAKELYHFRA